MKDYVVSKAKPSAIVKEDGQVLYCTQSAQKMFSGMDTMLRGKKIQNILEDDNEWEKLIKSDEESVAALSIGGMQGIIKMDIEMVNLDSEMLYLVQFLDDQSNLSLGINESKDIVQIIDAEGGIISVSNAFQTVTGYSKSDLEESDIFQHIHPEDVEVFKADFLQKISRKEKEFVQRYRFKHKAGDYLWFETTTELMAQTSSASERFISITRDITDWEEEERKTELIKTRFLEVFERIEEGIVYQDKNGAITSANLASQKILGLSLSQMQGRSSMHPDWRAIHEDGSPYPGETHPAMLALKTGKVQSNKIMGVFRPSDQSYVWIKVNSYPLFDSEEKAPSGTFTTFTDITREYQSTQALIESESKFRTLFNNAFQFIGLLRPDGTLIDANETGLHFLGVPKDEAVGTKLWQTPTYALDEESKEKMKEAIDLAAKGQFVRYDFNLTGVDGTTLTLDFSLRPVFNENNEVHLLIPEGRDITKRIRLEKALELEKELNAMQSHFVMSASHQFRTPLTIIKSNVEVLQLLREGLGKKERNLLDRYTDRISEQVERTVQLMDDILHLGKVTSGAISPHNELTDVVPLLKGIISEMNNTIEGDRIRMSSKGRKKNLVIDQKLFRESLNNLLSNALKYSNDNVDVVVSFEKEGAKICVRDRGIGVSEEDASQLFRPFFRSKLVSDKQGTGLGLAIAKEYIEVQGGTLTFNPEYRDGAEFVIQL